MVGDSGFTGEGSSSPRTNSSGLLRLSVLAFLLAVTTVVLDCQSAMSPASATSFQIPSSASSGDTCGNNAECLTVKGRYYHVLDGYQDLRARHPSVMKQNLDMVVAINNSADSALIKRAQADAVVDTGGLVKQLSYALGPRVGGALRAAISERTVPKTTILLDKGWASLGGGLTGSTALEKAAFNVDRPFQVAPNRIQRYNLPGNNLYPADKSFPSGHTNQSTWVSTLLAVMLPELGPQILSRSSESGYHRVVLGVHYPLDVIGGRMMGTAVAVDDDLDPVMGRYVRDCTSELRTDLERRLGSTIAEAVHQDEAGTAAGHETGLMSDAEAVSSYTKRMTYGFPQIEAGNKPLTVPSGVQALLRTRFPHLTAAQRELVIRYTALPSGYPLDNGEGWQRINLAAAFAAKVYVAKDGAVRVTVPGA